MHEGSGQSFEDFVAATSGILHRAALLLCGDHHLAEDLTQTTYAKLFAHWKKVQAADSPIAYARTVLTRTYLSHRRLRRSGEIATDALPERGGHDHDPSLQLDLLAALQRLSPDDRAVLTVRYWLDMSVAEAARTLRITEPAVRQKSMRALARLRKHVPHLSNPEESSNEPS